jgi:hypothetical protein
MVAVPIKPQGFEYSVSVKFELTGAVFLRLKALSESHYDGACRNASLPGGFLYGWGNELLLDHLPKSDGIDNVPDIAPEWTVEITASSGQLDKLLKIIEGEDSQFRDDHWDLHGMFYPLFAALRDEWRRLNHAGTQ